MGGNNCHPSSVETINRIRILCLTKNVKAIVTNSPVEMSDNDNFLSVRFIDNLDIDLDNKENDDDCEDDNKSCDVVKPRLSSASIQLKSGWLYNHCQNK